MRAKLFLISAIFCSWTFLLNAQQALNTTGGIIPITDNNLIEYSIGEVATATTGTPSSGNYYTAGVIQPWYNLIVNVADELFDNRYYLKVYPNPAAQQLLIETDFPDFQRFQFTNLLGQKVATGTFDYTPIDLMWMPTGTYFLTLAPDDQQISKTIKIIKQ